MWRRTNKTCFCFDFYESSELDKTLRQQRLDGGDFELKEAELPERVHAEGETSTVSLAAEVMFAQRLLP
jgi:hypothetical protein